MPALPDVVDTPITLYVESIFSGRIVIGLYRGIKYDGLDELVRVSHCYYEDGGSATAQRDAELHILPSRVIRWEYVCLMKS